SVAGPFALGNGETRTFTKLGTVAETTTNVVTASGTLPDDTACMSSAQLTVEVEEPPAPPVTCSDIKDITALGMVWDGPSGVNVLTEGGQYFSDVQNGNLITFNTAGLGNDVDLTLTGAVNGTSRFHVSCSDSGMDGSEDCGTAQGNSKDDKPEYLNDWLLNAMFGENGSFDCGLTNTGEVLAEVDPGADDPIQLVHSEVHDKKLKLDLYNNTAQDMYITRIYITWPLSAQELDKVKFNGDVAKDIMSTDGTTDLPADKAFEDDPNKRRIEADHEERLEIEFTEDIEDLGLLESDFSVTVEFDGGATVFEF
ncbi:MAG: hypothetical protein R3228_14835, partial [Halioglobus sp.]|nr:hypothetical protein [Halioglobus sp.]